MPFVEGGDIKGTDMLYGAKKKIKRWAPGRVKAIHTVLDDPDSPQLDIEVDDTLEVLTGLHISDCPLRNERDDTVDDLVKSDFLHEPGYSTVGVLGGALWGDYDTPCRSG